MKSGERETCLRRPGFSRRPSFIRPHTAPLQPSPLSFFFFSIHLSVSAAFFPAKIRPVYFLCFVFCSRSTVSNKGINFASPSPAVEERETQKKDYKQNETDPSFFFIPSAVLLFLFAISFPRLPSPLVQIVAVPLSRPLLQFRAFRASIQHTTAESAAACVKFPFRFRAPCLYNF